jgi:hypothetical protein
MRRRLSILVVASAWLSGCGAAQHAAPASAPASQVTASAPAQAAAPSAGVEQLPARAPLVARIDVGALRELELLALFSSALSLSDADAAALETASVAFLSVEPAQADARIVLVIDRARCVRACEGFVPRVEALGQPGDLRAGLVLDSADGSVVALVRAAVPVDASGDALRETLLESPVGVLSELRDAELRVERRAHAAGPRLEALLHARMANKGLASGLGLLLRDVTLKASDELLAVGLEADAQDLEALTLDVGEAEGAGDAMTVALDARLKLSASSLPAVVLAFQKSRARAAEDEALEQ